MKTTTQKGFTLLEILLVIAMIGILAAIVLIAINPNRQLSQARNTTRQSDTNTISKALEQYLIDTGAYPTGITTSYQEICGQGEIDCTGYVDLSVLIPTYLAAIPEEPGNTDTGSGYEVGVDTNGKISVRTPNGEPTDGSGTPVTIGTNLFDDGSSGGGGGIGGGEILTAGVINGWGGGPYGESGSLSSNNSGWGLPVPEPTLSSAWVDIAAGERHTIAIRSDGTLWGVGSNMYEQIRDDGGNWDDVVYPFTQIGTDTDWAFVYAAQYSSFALKTNGALYGWGLNFDLYYGSGADNMLGMGASTPDRVDTPTLIDAGPWVMVDGGNFSVAGVKTDGTLWVWGGDINGVLGLGSPGAGFVDVPTQVGSDTDWAAVSVGYDHAVAVKTNGTLWSWGNDGSGQLGSNVSGNGTLNVPTQVGSDTDWEMARAGNEATVALKTNGSMWAWGGNYNGLAAQDPNIVNNQNTPFQVGSANNWTKVDLNYSHVLALNSNGELYSWGQNYYCEIGNNEGQLVYGTDDGIPDQDEPVWTPYNINNSWFITAGGNSFVNFAAGRDFSTAITTTPIALNQHGGIYQDIPWDSCSIN